MFVKIFSILFFLTQFSHAQEQNFTFFNLELGLSPDQTLSNVYSGDMFVPSEDVLLKQLDYPTPFTLILTGKYKNFSFVKKIIIDFFEQKSYQMTIFLDPENFSFYSLSETLMDKYGLPKNRTSEEITWFLNNSQYKLSLEFPATIKVHDIQTVNQLINQQEPAKPSYNSIMRKHILDEL